MTEPDRPYHPIANLFPLLQGEEFEQLKADIAANGLLEAIWLHPDGSILDGRNRHRACIETGIEPRFRTWKGQGSLVSFVVSLNLHRRHLSSSQRAVVVLDVLPMLEAEARERQATSTGGADPQLTETIPEAEKGEAREQAADLFQTNPRYVSDAKRIQQDAPDLLEQVKGGTLTIPKATRELKKRKAKKKKQAREKTPEPAPLPVVKSPRLIVSRAEDMPEVEGETIDLIITSPPYNLGGNNWPMGGNGRVPRTDGIGYADDLDELAYQDWQVQCLIEFYRVAKPGASLFYNHKVRNVQGQIIHPMDWLRDERNPWTIRQEIIWDRGSTHNHNEFLFWPEDERIYWMTKGKPTLPERPIGMSNVWRFHGPVAGTWHPAPFSEELPERCIQALGREGITVLDPFAGSCPTCKVALRYGFEAVGVDVSQEYLERAAKENSWTMQNGI